MIRFQMLGTLELRDSQDREVRSVLRRPKLLALIGYLAIARPTGFHRRDSLVALLWPELDHAHARNALRQAVHAVRQALGHDLLLARGEEELAVDGSRIRCDVRDFEAAFEAGTLESAIELYRGALFSGFHVGGAPEFERWLDAEREHVRRRACQAAQLLVDREDTAGNAVGAVRWALRWVELAPHDETAVRRLMRLLDRTGDGAGAVRAYETLEGRLARDLELRPSAQTEALVEGIRARPHPERAAAAVPAEAATGGERVVTAGPTRVVRRRARGVHGGRAVRTRAVLGLALLVGVLLAGGWFLVGEPLGSRSAESTREPKRLVVLPFANVGPAEDEYFADGVTEEIAARLAAIDGLRVVGATSAGLYKNTEKTIQQIAAELEVDYLLEGTVRWQKSQGGPARVRVTPQLVSTADGTHLWADVYDAPLDEIFRVQSDIAWKVVRALDITLLDPERRVVETQRTGSLEAYDYYLRGNDYLRRGQTERNRRAAIRMYERAVEIDPRFALAYAQLSRMHSQMYGLYYDRSEARLAEAKKAVERAFELGPDLPEAHLAQGAYYFNGYAEYDRALREFAIAAARRPSDKYVFLAQAILRTRQGSLEEALVDFERARQIDPASPILASNYARAYELVRDYPRAEALYDHAIALSPDWSYPYHRKAGLYLRWEGSTQKARAVLDEARTMGLGDEPLVLLSGVWIDVADGRYEEAIGRLSSGAPEVIEDLFHVIPSAELYAQVYGLMGRPDLERVYYDSARSLIYTRVQERPEDPRLRSALGIAYAGLGRKREAIAEGENAVELVPIREHGDAGYHRVRDLARIYAMVGEHDAAVDRLEYLLSIPGSLTPPWLRIDPTWRPLRDHPRFQRLLRRAA